MKILAFSDSHGHSSSLEKLIQLEVHNKYDAIFIAGDIGAFGENSLNAKDVISMLSPFSCPILFVLGNSDPEHMSQNVSWPENGILLSEEPTLLGKYAVVGLNGIYDVSVRAKNKNHDYSNKKFHILFDSIKKHGINPRHVIILTHERIYNLNEIFTENPPLAYLFGHHHYPIHTYHRGTNYLNCSVLDNDRNRWGAGNYWVLNLNGEQFTATPKPLQRPSRIGCLAGGLSKMRQQVKLFNQLFPDLAISDPLEANFSTPVDEATFAKLISKNDPPLEITNG
jgi:predicted phosphodiesterase